MNYFREASRQKLRFNTTAGMLGVEQLWDMKLTPLSRVIKGLKKELNKDGDDELSFLDETSTPTDPILELSFNVAKEVYVTLKAERDALKTKAARKAHNDKIDTLIAQKQEAELGEKTVDELIAMRQE